VKQGAPHVIEPAARVKEPPADRVRAGGDGEREELEQSERDEEGAERAANEDGDRARDDDVKADRREPSEDAEGDAESDLIRRQV